MMKSIWAGMLAAAAISVHASAQDAAAIMKYAINTPGAGFTPYGPTQTMKIVKDGKVQGGVAQRIEITAKGPEAYTSGATTPVDKPIARGDRLMVAFWARAPKVAAGKTTPIPFAGLQLSSAPYTQFVSGSAAVGRDWQMFQVRGIADKDYAAGQVNVSLHLSAEKTVIDLGPVFVLDFGPPK